jgi:hypothetical protein
MICPRCDQEGAHSLATSPVPGVWEVFQCARCLYSWRNTEPERRTDPAQYPAVFKMTQADIDNAHPVPTVPPLRGGH